MYTILEWVAAGAGLINVFLLTRQSIWSWPAGLVSVFIYAFIFFHNKLYSDVLLHIVFVALNVYGWYKWLDKSQDHSDNLKVSVLTSTQRWIYVSAIALGSLMWGTIMHQSTRADYMYADAFILISSLCAQYLLAQKKQENWIIWIIVDIVAIILYSLKKLYVTSGLYLVYLILCIIGYVQWNHHLKTRISKISTAT